MWSRSNCLGHGPTPDQETSTRAGVMFHALFILQAMNNSPQEQENVEGSLAVLDTAARERAGPLAAAVASATSVPPKPDGWVAPLGASRRTWKAVAS